jgi:hypothetical protein
MTATSLILVAIALALLPFFDGPRDPMPDDATPPVNPDPGSVNPSPGPDTPAVPDVPPKLDVPPPDVPAPAPTPAPAPDVPPPVPAPASTPTVGDIIARVRASEARLAAANETYAADALALSTALRTIGHPVWDRGGADDDGLTVYEYSDVVGFKRTLVMSPTTPVPADPPVQAAPTA